MGAHAFQGNVKGNHSWKGRLSEMEAKPNHQSLLACYIKGKPEIETQEHKNRDIIARLSM